VLMTVHMASKCVDDSLIEVVDDSPVGELSMTVHVNDSPLEELSMTVHVSDSPLE
jgi:hypothetical protein